MLNIKLLKSLKRYLGRGGVLKLQIKIKYGQKRYSIYPIKILLITFHCALFVKKRPHAQNLGRFKDSRENVLCFYFSIVPAVPGKFQGLVLHKQNDSALEANKLPVGEWS